MIKKILIISLIFMQKDDIHIREQLEKFSIQDRQIINNALVVVENLSPKNAAYPFSIDVAAILVKFNVDLQTLLAAILSDERLELSVIQTEFGETVANLVRNVIWLNTCQLYSTEMGKTPNQAETLRQMLLSMTQDVRAMLIKLAYCLQRLRTLSEEIETVRFVVAQEILDIYAPIANRLGIHQFKWELEDLAFRYVSPKEYKHIAQSLAVNRVSRERCINSFIEKLKSVLKNEKMECACYGRPKHIYSIWKKMQRKNSSIDDLYDLLAVRVIVENLTQCYTVLGIVHNLWQMIPKEFDDYIANPKENGYQSLHTVILDEENNRIEVQIRTQEMHEYAELGVAAHWSYKEGGKQTEAMEKSVAMLRQLLEEKHGAESLSHDFQEGGLFNDRVYVLTPRGFVIDLIKGATPLDFAYAVHTEIGHRCRGAKVNGRIVPLTYTLKSGEQVEILTTKESAPNYNWIDPNLGYLKSARSIAKVKSWFKNQRQTDMVNAGKTIFDKECQRVNVKTPDLNEMLRYFKLSTLENFYEALGRNEITQGQLTGFFEIPVRETLPFNARLKKSSAKSIVTIAGLDNVQTIFAGCCAPILGDEIVGYISQHKGITVHRKDCVSIAKLSEEKQAKLVIAEWGAERALHAVNLKIEAFNAPHLLSDVSQIFAQAKIHVFNASLETKNDLSSVLNVKIQVENTEQLNLAIQKIRGLSTITRISRKPKS